ncbi:hypothetical protein [Gracilibacillus kekensis]|uniref:DUF2157 domain-containing protein n=1 Tax=Gracilibacillus kekensis TaxID=1027249 RepID=A0A1M7P3Q8_9BACI|nr:hypothetical protein [Gracilibacillus kekensis]SHN10678.1 hypothetical protein SAMN05216179_1923 [Gracilibacillus kekensis]
MDILQSEREKIVGQEMVKLLKQGYLSEEEFMRVMNSYKQYVNDQEQELADIHTVIRETDSEINNKEDKQQLAINKEVSNKKEPEIKQKVKPQKSKEQIRERNITWLLILGVAFLLISGLVVATSTWEQMGALLKVVTLVGVSVFFLGLSGISSSVLKIEKTAFAFLTLGSLLFPIAIIAIGYFGLFGDYLTLTGEGKYLLGIICTLLPLPLYARNAVKNNSRLFVWIFFLFMSCFAGFVVAAMNVSVDLFYFLIMVYNAVLLYGYHRYRHLESIRLFMKELPAYAQLNLVISTLLMLFVYNDSLFYSFNVLLTALIYISMVYVYNTKSYQLVFSGLFAYGVYQFTENSWLQSVDLFVYGLLGAAYLVFAYLMRKDAYLAKVFHYTSGVISLFAFIYISYQGLLIRGNEQSWTLLFAYLTIAGTYIYLSSITTRQVFRWLASIFIFTSGLELWDLMFESFLSIQLFSFIFASLLFIWIGDRTKLSYLQTIKTSTYYLSIIVMLLAIVYGLILETYFEASFMFLISGCLALIVTKSRSNTTKQIGLWSHAISWLLAFIVLYPEIISRFMTYYNELNIAFHTAIAGILLLVISLIWKKANNVLLAETTFYTGQASYLMAMFLLLVNYPINEEFVRPALLLIGIGVFVWLVRYARVGPLWLLVAVITVSFYASLIRTFAIEEFEAIMWYIMFAPVLLIVIGRVAGKVTKELKIYFFWFAHFILIMIITSILADYMFEQLLHPTILVIPFILYLYSMVIMSEEWEKKVFLYAAMSMVPFLVTANVAYYNLEQYVSISYSLIVSTVLFFVAWLFVRPIWKKRVEWYMIPFANYSLLMVIAVEQITHVIELMIIVGFLLLNLYLLHIRKWLNVLVLPLLLTILMWNRQSYIDNDLSMFIISIGSFIVLLVAGRIFYQTLVEIVSKKWMIDWYSVVAVLYLGYSLNFAESIGIVWIRILPYVLLAIWLFLQANRIQQQLMQKVFITSAGISLLPAYYIILQEYLVHISDLFHAELMVLPILILSIVMEKKTWKNHKRIMSQVQTVILVLITVYLVVDAIQSNTVWDALIVGTLSLVALLIGMSFQIKSYFFVGLGTLLFNVIYQTKPYWGNMPWWGYLLIAGITLITIASYNEWTKQRQTEGKLIKKFKQLMNRLKEWN